MKLQVTKKAVRESYSQIISVGYCSLQNLLRHDKPLRYTAGVYGWNADVHVVDGVAIVAGYRAFGTKVQYELTQRYDRIAAEIRARRLPYEDEKEKLHALAVEFVRKAVEELDFEKV